MQICEKASEPKKSGSNPGIKLWDMKWTLHIPILLRPSA